MKKFLLLVFLGAVLAVTAAPAKLSPAFSVSKDVHWVYYLGPPVATVEFWRPVSVRILNSRGSFYIPIHTVLVNHLLTS